MCITGQRVTDNEIIFSCAIDYQESVNSVHLFKIIQLYDCAMKGIA